IVFGLAIFLAFGMISTGFAAWLISSAATKDADAPVEVDTIVDKSFVLTIDQLTDNGWNGDKISFDAVKDDTTGRVKHQPEADGDLGEQPELTLSGTVTNVAALGKQPDGNNEGVLKIEITLPDSLKNAITEKYLTVSYTVGATGSVTTLTSNTLWVKPDASTGEFSITLKFGWGEKFNGMNPSLYYDQITNPEQEGYIPDAQMKTELAAFRATLIGANAEDADVFTKAYEGTIKLTVTASASY
ncbi:MAG: hypothetical protein IIY01_00145, partial [Clostridia bacterium]|nr:hypothetical protein [Clostridia bacterium]